MQLVAGHTTEHLPAVRELFVEDANALGLDFCFQNFDQELAELPGKYAPPSGRLFLALSDGQAVGCVALRKLEENICELKRLYVRPQFRAQSTGRQLAEAIIGAAREVGYGRMRLDTLASLKPAIALYESLGFQRIDAYYQNPIANVVYFELAVAEKLLGKARASHYHSSMRKSVTRPADATTPVPPGGDAKSSASHHRRATRPARPVAGPRDRARLSWTRGGRRSLLNGTVLFLADLIRHLSLPLRLDFIGVSSYGAGTESGELVFTKELRLDVRGRDVLLVDDILDTGKTLSRVIPKLRALKPRRIKVCVLLDKPSRRVEQVAADYVGFEIPDVFVVGYGLDYAEKYRNLPFVGVLKPEMYRT